jgi:hypothetical protein
VVGEAGEVEASAVLPVGLAVDTFASMRPLIMTAGSSVSVVPVIITHVFREYVRSTATNSSATRQPNEKQGTTSQSCELKHARVCMMLSATLLH